MFGKTGNFPFSWNDLRSISFQVLSTFPSVMVVSLRCKTCDHFSTKQGYFFRISGTLDLVTGGKFQTTVSSPLRSANPARHGRAHPHQCGRAGDGQRRRWTGGWGSSEIGGTTPCKANCNALEPTLPSPDKEWEPVPVTSNAERPLPTARGNVAGRSEGQ
jgi:hypothetical protein